MLRRLAGPKITGHSERDDSLHTRATRPESVVNGATILLVEDEPAIRQLMASALTLFGYRVLEARHGKEALDLFDGAVPIVDLLLRPGSCGKNFAQRWRVPRRTALVPLSICRATQRRPRSRPTPLRTAPSGPGRNAESGPPRWNTLRKSHPW
jgi:CheY-like chemotaxis protein